MGAVIRFSEGLGSWLVNICIRAVRPPAADRNMIAQRMEPSAARKHPCTAFCRRLQRSAGAVDSVPYGGR